MHSSICGSTPRVSRLSLLSVFDSPVRISMRRNFPISFAFCRSFGPHELYGTISFSFRFFPCLKCSSFLCLYLMVRSSQFFVVFISTSKKLVEPFLFSGSSTILIGVLNIPFSDISIKDDFYAMIQILAQDAEVGEIIFAKFDFGVLNVQRNSRNMLIT